MKIYSNYDNHHVKTTMVYANENKRLFHDSGFTKPVLSEKNELDELFVNGMIIVADSGAYRPSYYSLAGSVWCGDEKFIAADVEQEQ